MRFAFGLFLVVLDFDLFQVFGFENLAAIETFHVIDAIAARNYLRAVVITGGLHTALR